MEEEAVRWSVKVSKDTDLTLRTFLGAQGMKEGDLSEFHRGSRPPAHASVHDSGYQGAQIRWRPR